MKLASDRRSFRPSNGIDSSSAADQPHCSTTLSLVERLPANRSQTNNGTSPFVGRQSTDSSTADGPAEVAASSSPIVVAVVAVDAKGADRLGGRCARKTATGRDGAAGDVAETTDDDDVRAVVKATDGRGGKTSLLLNVASSNGSGSDVATGSHPSSSSTMTTQYSCPTCGAQLDRRRTSPLCEFVVCSAVLAVVLPVIGIPALVYSVRSQTSLRRGQLAASRTASGIALLLIGVGCVLLCAVAMVVSVLIALTFFGAVGDRPEPVSPQLGRARTAGDGNAYDSWMNNVIYRSTVLPPGGRHHIGSVSVSTRNETVASSTGPMPTAARTTANNRSVLQRLFGNNYG